MVNNTTPPKRPFCMSCSKPARLCLCNRIKTPLLDNSIPITILQHSHEKNHPLNSTRIALLGFKNITVFPVSDVHSQAQFLINSLNPDSNGTVTHSQNHFEKPDFDQISTYPTLEQHPETTIDENGFKNPQYHPGKPGFDQISAYPPTLEQHPETTMDENGFKNPQYHPGKPGFDQIFPDPIEKEANPTVQNVSIGKPRCKTHPKTTHIEPVSTVVAATIAKCGFTCSLTHLQTNQNHPLKPDFDQLLDSATAKELISNGFCVKKLKRKQLGSGMEFEDFVEFEIAIPSGSALLFPSAKAIGFGSLDFEVKHLVVLDGTWAKAKRMYHENPWLKLLPHLKLDPSKISLYSEVRLQPKAGCLSTIESIVCALKALGDENVAALDDLLAVFESMVEDQRRCKDERLSTMS